MGDYVLVTTTDSDAMPGEPAGAINGGMFLKKPEYPMQFPAIVIAVRNIEASMQVVREAGGEVLGEPHIITGIGRYVSFVDTESNRSSMLEPQNTEKGSQ